MTDTSIPPDPEEDALIAALLEGYDPNDPILRKKYVNGPGPDTFEPEIVEPDIGNITITEEQGTEGFTEEPVKVGDGECIVCGAPTFRPPGLTKAGHKKRTPKYCDLHASNVRVSRERSFSGGVDGAAQLQRIQEELADDLRLLGVMAGPLLPVTGYFVFENADPFTTALLKLCKNNQRALRVLHRAASVAPIYEVARISAGAFYSVQVDGKKLDPHNTVARRLGVEQAYNMVYPDDANKVESNGAMPGPPRYASTS